ncbi:MAG: YqaA family protein [Alphaproteobacteria bacterium]
MVEPHPPYPKNRPRPLRLSESKLYRLLLLAPNLLRQLYDMTMQAAETKGALRVLAIISFLESSVFPIPPDAFIVPMVLVRRERAWIIASLATFASVLGGYAGYAIGMFLFEIIATPLIHFYGYEDVFAAFSDHYSTWGFWIVVMAGFTPFPYKVITIASGALALDPVVFGIASILSRGARFFLVAAILYWCGAGVRRVLEQHLGLITTGGFLLLIGGFTTVKLFF